MGFFEWIDGRKFKRDIEKFADKFRNQYEEAIKTKSINSLPLPKVELSNDVYYRFEKPSGNKVYYFTKDLLDNLGINIHDLAKIGYWIINGDFLPNSAIVNFGSIENLLEPCASEAADLKEEILREALRAVEGGKDIELYSFDNKIQMKIGSQNPSGNNCLDSHKSYLKLDKGNKVQFLYTSLDELIRRLGGQTPSASDSDDEWLKWAAQKGYLTDRVVERIITKGIFRNLSSDIKRTVFKKVREKVKVLSQKTNSTDLTVEWLRWMFLWEILESGTGASREIKMYSRRFYYYHPELILFPTQFTAHLDDSDLKGLRIGVGGNVYNTQNPTNLGYDNAVGGLKVKINRKNWSNYRNLDIEVKIGGNLYPLMFRQGVGLVVARGGFASATGDVNGIKVKINNDVIYVEDKPIPIDLPISIERVSPQFIIETLRKGLFGILRSFNPQDRVEQILIQRVSNNVSFVWGPPATGKTQTLADDINNYMRNCDRVKKVLVLTPTNKAADVIAERLLTEFGYQNVYRFKVSMSDKLQQHIIQSEPNGCYVLVTTVHRYVYDTFNVVDDLKDIEWDKVYIDEASMVGLPFIVYTLLYEVQKNPSVEITISGDPYQLMPVGKTPGIDRGSIKGYSTENIYTILGYTQSQFRPNNYYHKGIWKTFGLREQKRSIEVIGRLYDDYMYNGQLKHDENRKIPAYQLRGVYWRSNNLNWHPHKIILIQFPVSKDFLKPDRIRKTQSESSYHLISGIFAAEFAKEIESATPDNYRIGIISPYGAQVSLIRGLVEEMDLKRTTVNTVHAFQGDERDIIIFVLNPPSTRPGRFSHFANKNLINVAISRARDYLFILYPDEDDMQALPKEITDLLDIANRIGSATVQVNWYSLINDVEIFNHNDINIYGSNVPKLSGKKYVVFARNRGSVDVVVQG